MRPLRATLQPRLLVWSAVAVAVIGGLLGMHALNLHAADPHHAPASYSETGATHGHSAAVEAPCDDCSRAGGTAHEEAVACILALLATLILLPRASPSWLVVVLVRSWTAAPRHALDRAAPLPSLYELSVIRT